MKKSATTKLDFVKSENFDKINERLDWLWYNTWSFTNKNGEKIDSNSEKICNITFELRGTTELYMIRFDRYVDDLVFNKVINNKYVSNHIGKVINIVKSGDFGSANEGFIASDDSLKLAINTLQQNGYEVGFKNYLE